MAQTDDELYVEADELFDELDEVLSCLASSALFLHIWTSFPYLHINLIVRAHTRARTRRET